MTTTSLWLLVLSRKKSLIARPESYERGYKRLDHRPSTIPDFYSFDCEELFVYLVAPPTGAGSGRLNRARCESIGIHRKLHLSHVRRALIGACSPSSVLLPKRTKERCKKPTQYSDEI